VGVSAVRGRGDGARAPECSSESVGVAELMPLD
jgi:hypothetical protein